MLRDGYEQARIVIDSSENWTGREDLLQHVIEHEFGHQVMPDWVTAWGRHDRHSPDQDSVMYWSAFRAPLRLSWSDQMQLVSRYERVRPIPQDAAGSFTP